MLEMFRPTSTGQAAPFLSTTLALADLSYYEQNTCPKVLSLLVSL